MKTFKQFIEDSSLILEKYYAPDEKLPSGNTPVKKAEKRGIKGDLLHKVKRGADNKNIDDSPQKGVSVSTQHGITGITHHDSGIAFDLMHKGELNGKPHYGINWWNLNNTAKTPEEKRKLAHKASHIWHHNVQPTLPHGSIVSNQPATSTHGKLYKRAGFGNAHPGMKPSDYETDDRYNRQYARVGRMPSPRQRAKGKKTRLTPVEPPKEKQPIKF